MSTVLVRNGAAGRTGWLNEMPSGVGSGCPVCAQTAMHNVEHMLRLSQMPDGLAELFTGCDGGSGCGAWNRYRFDGLSRDNASNAGCVPHVNRQNRHLPTHIFLSGPLCDVASPDTVLPVRLFNGRTDRTGTACHRPVQACVNGIFAHWSASCQYTGGKPLDYGLRSGQSGRHPPSTHQYSSFINVFVDAAPGRCPGLSTRGVGSPPLRTPGLDSPTYPPEVRTAMSPPRLNARRGGGMTPS